MGDAVPTEESKILTGLIQNPDPSHLREFLQSLVEADPSRNRLTTKLAEFSLRLYQNINDKDRATATAKCEFSKALLKELLERRKNGENKESLLGRLNEASYYYAIIVQLPYQATQIKDSEMRKSFWNCFTTLNFKNKPYLLPAQYRQPYSEFNDAIRENSLAVRQGISEELFACCLLEKSGYNPEITTVKEDVGKGSDITIIQTSGKKINVQVKTDSYSPRDLFTVVSNRNRILIALNTKMIERDPNLTEQLLNINTKTDHPMIINFSQVMKEKIQSCL